MERKRRKTFYFGPPWAPFPTPRAPFPSPRSPFWIPFWLAFGALGSILPWLLCAKKSSLHWLKRRWGPKVHELLFSLHLCVPFGHDLRLPSAAFA